MQDRIDHNDVAYLIQQGFEPKGWIPGAIAENGKINPQVTKAYLGGTRFASVFSSKPKYYETTTGHWRPLSEITVYQGNKKILLNDKWRNASSRYIDWLQKRQTLLGSELLLPTPFGMKYSQYYARPELSVGLTTTTVYPDPNVETTTVDGHAVHDPNSSNWATVHDATASSLAFDDITLLDLRAEYRSGPEYVIARIITLFDTSSIGGDTISSATLSLYRNNASGAYTNGDNDGDDFVTVVQSNPASNTAVATGDYDQVGDAITNPTEGVDTGNRIDLSTMTTDQYYNWSFNSTGIGWVNGSGVTKLGVREGHDVINSAITASITTRNRILFSSAEETGTTQDPKFVVVHTAAASSFIPKVIMF